MRVVCFLSVLLFTLFVATPCYVAMTSNSGLHCPEKCSCSSHFKWVSCTGKGLLEVPPDIPPTVTELYLGKNLLTELPAHVFSGLSNLTTLSLIENHIATIDKDAFVGLSKLKILYLRRNKLVYLPDESLRDLSALTNLYLTDNQFLAVPNVTSARRLIRFLLDNNMLTSAKFAPEFANMTSLSTIGLANNPKLTKVDDDDFRYLPPSIRSIDLSRCGLTDLGSNIFRNFRRLQSLSLSYIPNWTVSSLQKVVNSLTACNKLSSLDLSGTISTPGFINLPPDVFQNLSSIPLTTLNLAHMSGVDLIDGGMFRHFPILEKLDMSYGKFSIVTGNISFMPKLWRLTMASSSLKTIPKLILPGLTFLDLSGCNEIDMLAEDTFIRVPMLENLVLADSGIRTVESGAFVGLSRLQILDLSGNGIGGSSLPVDLFSSLLNLQTLNLRRNKMTVVKQESRLFENLRNLRHLDFGDNRCSTLATGIFRPLTSVLRIDLDNNMLGGTVIGPYAGDSLFNGLASVETINLQSNGIEELPPGIFNATVSLRMVNLTGNKLKGWSDATFNMSTNLSMVDLSSNGIAVVLQSSIGGLPSNNVRLNLSGNPFACWCDLIWFRRWIAGDPNVTEERLPGLSNYKCNSPASMVGKRVLDFNPDDIERSCHPPPWLLIVICATCGSIALIVAVITVAYRYRWSLRLRVYYVGKRFRRRKTRNGYNSIDDGGSEQYDLLVSYFSEDDSGEWVRDVLVPTIDLIERGRRGVAVDGRRGADGDVKEDGNAGSDPSSAFHGNFRVFYEDGCILPNQNVIGQIDEAMKMSRKVMIVASEKYAANSRRQFEVDMAVEHGFGNVIIVLWQNEAVGVQLPRILHRLLDRALTWPNDNREGQEYFWRQLNERLMQDDDVEHYGSIQNA